MKDIDLEAMVVRIHRGKGAKDEIYLRLARAMRGEMGSPLDRLSDLGES